jgi:hypothetical protein
MTDAGSLPPGWLAACQTEPKNPAPSATPVPRRDFLTAAAVGAAAVATLGAARAAARRRSIPLGYDNFAVRACGWNARKLVDHAESLRCDSLFITDFGPFEADVAEARRPRGRGGGRPSGTISSRSSPAASPIAATCSASASRPDPRRHSSCPSSASWWK